MKTTNSSMDPMIEEIVQAIVEAAAQERVILFGSTDGCKFARVGKRRLDSNDEAFTMKFYSFEIVIEKEPEDEGYFAYSPTLPGCFSNGKTIEETKRNMREAVEQHLASLLDHAQSVPQHERLVHVEELSIGVPE